MSLLYPFPLSRPLPHPLPPAALQVSAEGTVELNDVLELAEYAAVGLGEGSVVAMERRCALGLPHTGQRDSVGAHARLPPPPPQGRGACL